MFKIKITIYPTVSRVEMNVNFIFLLDFSAKNQFDDGSIIDHSIIEDDQNIEEKEVNIKPKMKGRPGRKKGKHLIK